MTEDRRVRLKGTYNFRDLGGYRTLDGRTVKPGRIFRSDNLARLSTTAFDRFLGLHIKLIVDFRTAAERDRRPNRLPQGHTIRTEHLPISLMPALENPNGSVGLAMTLLRAPTKTFPPDLIFSMYANLVDNAVPALQRLFQLLLDPANHPTLIMCAGGKDRTGFASAMILNALGVPQDVVAQDYALTGHYGAPLLDRVVRNLRLLSLFRVPDANIRPLLLARPEYLATALQRVHTLHGGVEAYLQTRLGLSQDGMTRLQTMLLEP
jgi:protein-tyrosine phosphatase